MLEEAAVKANGLFRVCKLNSERERPLSEALQVRALICRFLPFVLLAFDAFDR